VPNFFLQNPGENFPIVLTDAVNAGPLSAGKTPGG